MLSGPPHSYRELPESYRALEVRSRGSVFSEKAKIYCRFSILTPLNPNSIEFLEFGALEKSELKGKRVIDRRGDLFSR